LGEGGFGRVWLAKSSITEELAAIKLIKLEKISK
jgi:serine/threonine protein kinase